MIFKQFYLPCLSHASYLIGDETTGTAVVVDPHATPNISTPISLPDIWNCENAPAQRSTSAQRPKPPTHSLLFVAATLSNLDACV